MLPVENMMSKICIPVALLLLPLLLPTVCEGSSNLRKFGQHYARVSWKVAQAHCRWTHTDLITIRGKEENENFYGGHGWMGLYRQNSTSQWKWSRGDEEASFTYWDLNEPDPGQNCAYRLSHTDKWHSDYCHIKRTFMCHNEMLVLVKELKTWEQALEHCRGLEAVDPSKPATAYQNHRYDLASLLTEDDHAKAWEMMIEQGSTDEVWTGLRYLAGQWKWVGGEEVQYEGLDKCPTLQFCGVLDKKSEASYYTRQCSWKNNFLCYAKY